VKDAGLETLVSEAKGINQSTSLLTMVNIFKELSNVIPSLPSAEEIDFVRSLLKHEIFPLYEGGDTAAGFDELSVGVSESEWYIADRTHLREFFQHGQVAILAFTVKDVHAIQKLINVLQMDRRLLSSAAKEITKVEGESWNGGEIDLQYRAKVKYLNRYVKSFRRELPSAHSLRESLKGP
jgi:hypothetical protein